MAISLTGILLITAGLCGIMAIISYYIKQLKFYGAARNFPGPFALPIFGNVLSVLGSTEEILNKTNAIIDQYPSPFRAWIGNKLYFVLYDADHIKTALLSNNAIEKDRLYKFVQPWIGTGLITAPAAKSKIHRKLVIPTFHQKNLDSFVGIFNEQSKTLTTSMRKELGKGEFDVFQYMSLCHLDIICETAMGVSINSQMGHGNKYVNAMKRELEIIYLRMIKIWLHPDFIFNLSNLGKDHSECLKYLHGTTNYIIEKKRKPLKTAEKIESEDSFSTQEAGKNIKVFLDHMMEVSKNGQKLTDKELREEVNTMIVAGTDTSATVSSFTIMMLAIFPEIQERVYQELCGIYGEKISSDMPIDKEDLNRMDYLERVIKESMRLFPPTHFLARRLTGDIQIDGKILPEGSSVALSIFKLHRWEKYWPNPLKFDPDRFLPEKVAERHQYCYLPFSGGSRGCVGQRYAIMSLKIVLATVLRRYILIKDQPMKVQDIKLKADGLLKPAEPLNIRIVERTVDPKR